MKYIWVFKVSDKWRDCDGGLVIISKSFEEAQSLIKSYNSYETDAKLYKNEHDIPEEERYNVWMDTWVLVEKIKVSNTEKSRVVSINYYCE